MLKLLNKKEYISNNCAIMTKYELLSFPSSSLGMHTEITTRKEEDK